MYTDHNQSISSEPPTTVRGIRPPDASARPDSLGLDEPAPAWPSAVFDEIDYGMLVLDARRKVILANRAAIAQLNETGELILKNDELVAIHARDVRELAAAIRGARHLGRIGLLRAGRVLYGNLPPREISMKDVFRIEHNLRRFVMIGRPGNQRALAIVPLQQQRATEEAHVLILFSRQKICEPLSVSGFSRVHDLTAAESRVLLALCQGHQPAQIAASHDVAISTVRTQITRLRQKTNASSIGDIVQCVARLPPIRVSL
mgnify:CR=1 FL=1